MDDRSRRDDAQFAIIFYQHLVAQDQNDPRARRALKAGALIKYQEEGAIANAQLTRLRRDLKAEIRTAGNDLERRIDLYINHLIPDPCNSSVRSALAGLLLRKSHVAGAAAEAEMAMNDDPDNAEALSVLVESLLKLGKKKEARAIETRLKRLKSKPRQR